MIRDWTDFLQRRYRPECSFPSPIIREVRVERHHPRLIRHHDTLTDIRHRVRLEEESELAEEEFLCPSPCYEDSEKLYFKICSSIAAKYNKRFTAEIHLKMMGTLEEAAAQIIIDELHLPLRIDEFILQRRKICMRYLPYVHLMPGAEKLVYHLYEHGIPTAIGTSSGLQSVKIKTSHHKTFMSLFHHIVSGTSDPEVKCGKPSPDIFLVTASRFDEHPDPEMCLVFEDAPLGLRAGLAAGMQVAFIPDERVDEDVKKDATITLKSMEEFRPEWFGLPPY